MTIYPVRPGCFGSALFYSVNASECSACSLQTDCAKSAQERARPVLETVQKFDTLFDLERAPAVAKWIARRFKRDTSSDRKSALNRVTLDRWKSDGLNVYELRHRMVPATKDKDLQIAFKAIVDNGSGFNRRDLAEELQAGVSQTKAGAKRFADTVCDALLEAGVLKNESRGILCLNS
jgi:hypothetical protein